MQTKFDVVVIGGGAMGSAAAWQLAKRGRSVALLEQFGPAHANGSSHGGSRIYRATYSQSEYLDLMAQALPMWDDLEEESGAKLLTRVGLVSHGFPPHDFEEPMRAHGIPLDVLSAEEAEERWPGMKFEGKVLYEHSTAGRVNADLTLAALQHRTAKMGGEIHHNTKVLDVQHVRNGMIIETTNGVFLADRVVLAAGGWTNKLAPKLLGLEGALPLSVVEVAPAHFQIKATFADATADPATHPAEGEGEGKGIVENQMTVANWPAFTHDHAPTNPATGEPTRWPGIVYGLGTDGEGIKVGFNAYGRITDPDERTWQPREGDLELHADYVREWLPGLVPESAEFMSCTYTRTPSDDFLLDRVGRVIVASPCSGHGFKFTPVLGKMIADLACEDIDAPVQGRPELFALRALLG